MYRDPSLERWQLVLLVATAAVLLLLLHTYRGLVHDSQLYTLQALNWLHPDLYGNDVFLRYGSQDDFTLFPPLYGWFISLMGLEPAAATVTFGSILLFLVACFAMARTLMPMRQSLAAIVLLLLIPAHYGPAKIFHYLEEFATPRQLAEALVLFSLAAWLRSQRVLATVLALGAMLIHPIIGLAGAVVAPTLEWIVPRWRRLWPLAALAGLVVLLAASGWLPISNWQFDDEWYAIVMNRTYLGLLNWNSEDWARVTTVLATLAAAAVFLTGRLQQIPVAILGTTSALLLLALVGGDLLHITIVVQAQPWRALWLGTVVAVMLLPSLYTRGWRHSPLARCALLLLAAAWVTSHGVLALVAAPISVAAMTFRNRPISDRSTRLMLLGAWLVLAVAVLHGIAVAQLTWNEGLTALANLPPTLDRLLLLNHGGVLLAVIAVGVGYVVVRSRSRHVLIGLSATLVTAGAAVAGAAAGTWTSVRFDSELRSSFGNWRALIPPGSNVLWTGQASDRDDGAFYTWVLLERPSFMSRNQAPNALFSRPAAIEMYARVQSLQGLLPFWNPFGEDSKLEGRDLHLESVCRNTNVSYIVTREHLADSTGVPAPHSAGSFLRDYSLHICP